jgi:thymidine kinase
MPFYEFGGGWLEVITGPMFSGKSEELIRRVTRALIARQHVQVFKPTLDDRYDSVAIASHNGRKLEAQPVGSIEHIEGLLRRDTQVVAVDEGQFLSKSFTPLALRLADEGMRVVIAGLDLDFRGIPFGPMPELLAQAEVVVKLTAICSCGRAATRTQRLIQGQPAHTADPVILVGASESYEPRCREHHIVLTAERVTPLFGREPLLVE